MKFRALNYAHALHHVTMKQKVKLKSGKQDEFILLYIKPEGAQAPIVLKELFDFFSQNASKSLSWQRHMARAVGLFYDYCVVKSSRYKNDNDVADAIRGFVEISLSGDAELGWAPTSISSVKRNLSCVIEFSKYTSESQAENLLPADSDTKLKYLYRAFEVKKHVLLSHVTNVKRVADRIRALSKDHLYKFNGLPNSRYVQLFPEDMIDPLFIHGFEKSNGEDLGCKMITALMLFGGMRNSEPFHLWFNDFSIYPSTGGLGIFLHHPSESACNIPPYANMSRKEYLMHRGLNPRNDRNTSKSYHAGWKNLAVDNLFRTEIRLIHKKIESHFLTWWNDYMSLRQTCMEVYKEKHGHEHPFFFVKTGDKNDTGAPLSMASYIKSLKRAISRLQKKGYLIEWGYNHGVSPHPMRHWFITKLEEHDVSPKIIQSLANHRNIMSQEVYKGANAKEIDEACRKISKNLHFSF